MLSDSISFRLARHVVLATFALAAGTLQQNVKGTPAPKPTSRYVLLYIPKKTGQYETTQYRRRQISLLKTNSPPFVLYWAIRSLKNTDLPSLPKKGKGGEAKHDHDEDIAWLAQNLKVEYLDGTGVLRVSLAAGTRREEALLVNAIVDAYFQLEVDRDKRDCERCLEELKKTLTRLKGEHGAKDEEAKEIKNSIKKNEDALRTLPRLLELADVPPE